MAALQQDSSPASGIQLIVYSDFNCAWCYVAHKEISAALSAARAAHPDISFKLEYRPFELDPALKEDKPMCRIACYKAKFGEQRMNTICKLLSDRGKSVGINFHWKGKVRQTTNAHRLVLKSYLCGGEALQAAMLDQLFALYFEEETDIGCYDALSNAAVTAGLFSDADEARDFLQSDLLCAEVKMLVEDAQFKGIKGVPCTIINNRWSIQGAEKAEVFFNCLDRLAQSISAATNGVSSHSSPSSDTTTVPTTSSTVAVESSARVIAV